MISYIKAHYSTDSGKTPTGPTPREKLANQLASVLEMQRRKQTIQEDGRRLLASQYPGGLVSTPVVSFTSPQFSKVGCRYLYITVKYVV